MNSMVKERECRGKHYVTSTQEVPGHYEEFERGTFLGFGIDYEEFESGPAQYTTAIVELKDGNVITTPPEFIQFINAKTIGKPLVKDSETMRVAKKGRDQRSERKRIDHRKIRALKNAGWSNKEIADEMHMTPGGVANSLSTHKELIEELKEV